MGRSTSEPCHYELTCDFVYPSCLIHPRECHLHSCQSSFSLEVSHQWKWLASVWNLIKVFPSKAFDEAVRKRESSDQCNMSGIIKVLYCPHTGERPRSFLFLTVPTSLFPHDQCTLHRFLCSPLFINLGTIFHLRGRAITPHVTFPIITFIRGLIMHQVLWLIKF
jgi:hypothetical protein